MLSLTRYVIQRQMKHLRILALVVILLVDGTSSARILLVPSPEPDRFHDFLATARALQHETRHQSHWAWLLLPEYYISSLDVEDLDILTFKTEEFDKSRQRMSDASKGPKKGNIQNMMNILRNISPDYDQICSDILSDKLLSKVIAGLHFDLAVVDGSERFTCSFLLALQNSIPYVTMTETLHPWSVGVTALPSNEPSPNSPYSDQMTFFQRIANSITYVKQMAHISSLVVKGTSALQRHVSSSYYELYKKSQLWIANQEVTCLEYSRMSAPHVKYIGGFLSETAKRKYQLPLDIHELVDKSLQGVVVVSLEPTTPGYEYIYNYLSESFIQGFGRLKQNVIMKCKDEDYQGLPENVKCVNDLDIEKSLANEKTVAFVSHGSNNHHIQAGRSGVPILSIPITDQQKYYGKRSEAKGLGLTINAETFTADDIVAAMLILTFNQNYRDKSEKCGELMKGRLSPETEIVFWIEHIIKYGGDHLRPSSLDRGFVTFLNLDLAFLLFLFISLGVTMIYIACRFCAKRCIQERKWNNIKKLVGGRTRRLSVGLSSIFTDNKQELKTD